ncbi:MAG TPA: hypothetical protein VET65_11910 [Candidatus Limnocylindrales bacterium]|nr:hypothetical protein [Candidatus Limnocylindrales bacterium]
MSTTLTTPITVPYPAVEGPLELRISAGACRLHLAPGDHEAWITGSYVDPSGGIAVSTEGEGNRMWIRVGRSPADMFGVISGVPELTLHLGRARPFSLMVEAGASENQVDLGGLPLLRAEMNHGAGSMEVTFSTPNPVPMTLLKFGVGAGRTQVTQLGNANFEELSVEGGAASYLLDFGGAFTRPAEVRLATAMASVEARIPRTLAVELTSENLLGQPRLDGGFTRKGSRWLSQAAAAGGTPLLRIRSTMVLGQLTVVTV